MRSHDVPTSATGASDLGRRSQGGLRPRALHLLGIAVALLLALSSGQAQADDLTAEQIANRMVRANAFQWDGAKASLRMVLISKKGKRKERRLEVMGRRSAGLMQTMLRFTAPADVAGTAFLMLEKKDDDAEQYVYLSGLKRTRRVVGRERDGSFMGSDFSYADMQPPTSRHNRTKRLADEAIGSDAAYVVETTIGKGAASKYSKVVSWVRKRDMVALRTRFYDRSGKLLKTLYTRKVRKLEGKPVVVQARMENAQNGHVTELHVDALEPRSDLTDKMFTPAALERY